MNKKNNGCVSGIYPRAFSHSKGLMKGIDLPVNMIVVISIAVIILMALSAFFLTGSGRSITRAEAEKIFSLACSRSCSAESDWRDNVVSLYRSDEEFSKNLYESCVVLGHAQQTNDPNVRTEGIVTCLQACGNCDISMGDTQGNIDNIGSIATGGLG